MPTLLRSARAGVATCALAMCAVTAGAQLPAPAPLSSGGPGVPRFAVDPFWPKPLPGKWVLGQVSGVAVDRDGHVWIVHRPKSLSPSEVAAAQTPPTAECCVAAPPVIEFDRDGSVLRAWGGPNEKFHWPDVEHSIYVDGSNHVWIGGTGKADHTVLEFSADGDLLLQIGRAGQTGGSNDTTLLGAPAAIEVDDARNEVYIGDGYVNKRVIVFDARPEDTSGIGVLTDTGPKMGILDPTIRRRRPTPSSGARCTRSA